VNRHQGAFVVKVENRDGDRSVHGRRLVVENPPNRQQSLVERPNSLEGANGQVDGLSVACAGRADVGDLGNDRFAVVRVLDGDPSSAVR
jgi:hypothetical protein